jgi:hypothetical protein
MNTIPNIPRLILTSWVATALLTSCSGGIGSPGSGFPQTSGRFTTSIAVKAPLAIHRDTRASWISPDVKRAPRLLFVSDAGTEDVDIFSLPDLALKGTITGFSEPQGMCSGTGGTVWVANTGTEQVMQLSRTGKLLNTIDDAYGYPVGCAVNQTDGDIAVFNIFGISGAGSAYVYSCLSCTPTELTIPGVSSFEFGDYDPSGDLFVNAGRNSTGSAEIGEVPSGKTSGHLIRLTGGSVYFPGLIQWYKPSNYLAVGDQLCNDKNASCIYWVKIRKSTGRIIGHTALQGSGGSQICDMVQGVLDPAGEKTVLGGNYNYCGSGPSTVNRWQYPAGGVPTNSADFTASYSLPDGAAISGK